MALKHHVAFAVGGKPPTDPEVFAHFEPMGYRPADPAGDGWVFRRGDKLAAFWRFDIRAYDTTLRVRADPQREGGHWISCDFEVWTCMNIITRGDVATLEAEARGFESVLRRAR